MSIKIMSHVWQHSKQKGAALLLLLAIADSANEDTGDTWMGNQALSEKVRLTDRYVQLLIGKLEEAGELLVFPRMGIQTSSGWTNLYRVVTPWNANTPINSPAVSRLPPNGLARKPAAKLKRKQRKGVKQDSPPENFEGVNQDSPDEVNQDSPDEVNQDSPKPLQEPSEEPNTFADASGAAPKSTSKKQTVPKAQMDPMKNAIAAAFNWTWEGMTSNERGLVQKAARELCLVNFNPADVADLHGYCAQTFDQFKPMALVSNVSEWRKFKTPKTTAHFSGQTKSRWAGHQPQTDFPVFDSTGKWIGQYLELVAEAKRLEMEANEYINRLKSGDLTREGAADGLA